MAIAVPTRFLSVVALTALLGLIALLQFWVLRRMQPIGQFTKVSPSLAPWLASYARDLHAQARPVDAAHLRRHRYGFVARQTGWKNAVPREPVPLLNADKATNATRQPMTNWSTDTRFYAVPLHAYPKETQFLVDRPDACGPQTKGIFVVITAPSHLQERNHLREMYPPPPELGRIFLLGIPILNSHAYTACHDPGTCSVDEDLKERVMAESSAYKDIVMYNHFDIYQFLSFKVQAGFRWATSRCAHVPFFLKIDDDAFPHYRTITRFMRNVTDAHEGRPELGWYGRRMTWPVMRHAGKNIVRREQYPEDIYPYFASGSRYFMTMDVAAMFRDMAFRLPYLPVEDVWCGLAGHLLGLEITSVVPHPSDTETIPPCDLLFIQGGEPYTQSVLTAWRQCNITEPHTASAAEDRGASSA